MQINIKKLTSSAVFPSVSQDGSGIYDLYADFGSSEFDNVPIQPGKWMKISTGISVKIPEGYVGFVYARASLATKNGLRPANCVGIVGDDDYKEIRVALYNDDLLMHRVAQGDRIARIVIQKVESVEFVIS